MQSHKSHIVMTAKMLITFVGRHKGEDLVAAAKSAGARGGTLSLGQSLGNSRLLQALSLGDIQQDVIFTVMGEEGPAVIGAMKRAAEADPKKFSGMAVLLNVPDLIIKKHVDQPEGGVAAVPFELNEEARVEVMESGYKLITVIVNSGYADDVMAVARGAGATGGTIINARGTGTQEDVKFFGITLVPEKEMLMIVSPHHKVGAIARAIATVPTLAAPGGGIIFTQNVEQFIILGQQKTWEE